MLKLYLQPARRVSLLGPAQQHSREHAAETEQGFTAQVDAGFSYLLADFSIACGRVPNMDVEGDE